MAPDLHRDPAALRSAAQAIDGVLPTLRVRTLDPADLAAVAGGVAFVAEHDRILAATARVRRELADVAAALRVAADATERADRAATGAVTAVRP